MNRFFSSGAVGFFLLLLAAHIELADAGVQVGGTRIVYPADENEVTVALRNRDSQSALVQVWLDEGQVDLSPAQIDVPFMLTPPIVRMDPDEQQMLRIRYTGQSLPADKESLFWLNVLQVPPKQSTPDAMQVAFRTRIKVFFRPQGLSGSAAGAPAMVTWQLVPTGPQGYSLKGSNPTPYYANFADVVLSADGRSFSAGQGFIPPGESQTFSLLRFENSAGALQVKYVAIDDGGNDVPGTAHITALRPLSNRE